MIITGAGGFIGQNLIKHILQDKPDQKLILVDTEEGLARIPQYKDNHCFVSVDGKSHHDVLREIYTDNAPLSENGCIHLGGISDPRGANWDQYFETNVLFTKALFGSDQSPFIFASSASVYGEMGWPDKPVNVSPRTQYAHSKLAAERVLATSSQRDYAILRLFNVYGPHEDHKGKHASVIHQCHQAVKNDEVFKLFENSDLFTRDFIHVQDVVESIWNLMKTMQYHYGNSMTRDSMFNPYFDRVYDVGSGMVWSFESIAEYFSKYHGMRYEIVPFPKEYEGRYQRSTYTTSQRLMLSSSNIGVEQYINSLK